MKVAVLAHGMLGWAGGIDFLKGFCGSLISSDPDIEVHVLMPTKGPIRQLRDQLRPWKARAFKALGVDFAEHKIPEMVHAKEAFETLGLRCKVLEIDDGNRAIARAVGKHGLQAIVLSTIPFKELDPPWMGYLPDLQHKHYPNFFTQAEIDARDRYFTNMLTRARMVLVNSQAVADDIAHFFPRHESRLIVLPFNAAPQEAWFEKRGFSLEKYKIQKPYFLISNQFWLHKDHLTAWSALSRVLLKFPEARLVCTGETHDHRRKEHYPLLMERAKALGIEKNLSVLGLVPKHDQIQIMREALAVVQPTLFEGGPGGGSVYDAVSLGVPCIVSDIKVNLELKDHEISFFKAGDDESLAAEMRRFLLNPPAREAPATVELLSAGEERRARCGRVILDAVRELA